jgi:tetratricopeptide (TPR) repeat protein
LGNLGLYREQLEMEEILVQLSKQLMEKTNCNQSSRCYYASTLHNVARTYLYLNQHEKAFCNMKEAVEIYQELASADPNKFQGCQVSSLNVLSNMYSNHGQYREALALI